MFKIHVSTESRGRDEARSHYDFGVARIRCPPLYGRPRLRDS